MRKGKEGKRDVVGACIALAFFVTLHGAMYV